MPDYEAENKTFYLKKNKIIPNETSTTKQFWHTGGWL